MIYKFAFFFDLVSGSQNKLCEKFEDGLSWMVVWRKREGVELISHFLYK